MRRLVRETRLHPAQLVLPVFVAEMGGHLIPGFHMWLHGLIGMQALWVVEFVLVTLVMIGPVLRLSRRGAWMGLGPARNGAG